MFLKATIDGNLKAAMQAEVAKVSGALRRAVITAAKEAQGELRAQARATGFRDGGRAMANAWRMEVYPRTAKTTLRPAALVYSKMPDAVEGFDKGAFIHANGDKYLAWPTPINRTGTRRVNGKLPVRVTPVEMFRSGGFVVKTRKPGLKLWCLPLTSRKTRRGRTQIFAGPYARVMTANRKGAEAFRAAYARDRSFVPMFFLAKAVSLRKRLDIAAVRARASRAYARAATAELSRLPR